MAAAFDPARDVSATGDPFSQVFVCEIASLRFSISSASRRRYPARSDGARSRQPVPEDARRAAATARSTSPADATGTLPQTSSVAGLVTMVRPVPSAAVHAPSMNRSVAVSYTHLTL